jgi:hypothetical protein
MNKELLIDEGKTFLKLAIFQWVIRENKKIPKFRAYKETNYKSICEAIKNNSNSLNPRVQNQLWKKKTLMIHINAIKKLRYVPIVMKWGTQKFMFV